VEIDAVARAVRHALGWRVRDPATGETRPARPADVAVLVRRIDWGDELWESLRRAGIPATVAGGKRFYAREEIATLHTLLRAVLAPDDDFARFAALRCPAFGLPDDVLTLHFLPGEDRRPQPEAIAAENRLRELTRLARELAVPDFLERLAEELSLPSVFGFRADGRARVEALRILIEAADSLADAGVASLPEFVRWLGRQAAESRSGAPGESDLVAAIAPLPGKTPDPKSIFAAAAAALEPNSVPTYLLVLDEIPKTITEKPQERFMKKIFEEDKERVFTR